MKGIALGANKKVVPVSTLEAMAEPLREMHVNVCAVMDARRNELYNAVFDAEGKRLTEDRAIPIEVLEKDLQTLSGPILLVGDGSQLCYNHFKEKPWELCIADEQMQCRGGIGRSNVD